MAPTDLDARVPWAPIRQHLGLTVVEWEDGRAVVELPAADYLSNFSGAMSGPAIAAAIDMAGVLAGVYRPEPEPPLQAVTLDLSVSFVRAAIGGGPIRALGRLVGGGRTIFMTSVEVTDDAGAVVAIGKCTSRYVA